MDRGSPNIEMDEHTFLVNRERAVDYLNSLDKVSLPTYYLLSILCFSIILLLVIQIKGHLRIYV